MMQNQKKSYIYAFVTVFLWSTVASAFKIGLDYYSPDLLLLISSIVSTVFFFTLMLNHSKKNLYTKDNIIKSLFAGLLNPFLYYLILFKAYDMIPAQVAQPLNYTWIIVVTVLMSISNKKRLSIITISGLLISFTGVVVISAQGNASGKEINIIGVGLALISSVFWGFYWLINLKDTRQDVEKLFMNFFVGTIFISIYVLIFSDFKYSFEGTMAGIYIGLFEMGATFFVWLKALKYSEDTGKTGNIIYLTPFISLIFISLILKEVISLNSFLGLILIIGGIVITSRVKNI